MHRTGEHARFPEGIPCWLPRSNLFSDAAFCGVKFREVQRALNKYNLTQKVSNL